MANITLPSPESEFAVLPEDANASVTINRVWYQKFVEWLRRSNKVSPDGLTITATSDTNLRFSYVGSDGTTRVADLTLA